MRRASPGTRRGLVLAVAGLFAVSLLGEAYALHECDHHHAAAVGEPGHHAGSGIDSGAPHRGAEGPCCCPDGFHSQSALLPPLAGPEGREGPRGTTRLSLVDRAAMLGFRALPAEFLPRPNAPPIL